MIQSYFSPGLQLHNVPQPCVPQLYASQPKPSGRSRRSCSAFSLLEVVAALAVITLILMEPTTGGLLGFMRDVQIGQSVQRQRGELIHLAQGKQAEFCHFARADFREHNESASLRGEA